MSTEDTLFTYAYQSPYKKIDNKVMDITKLIQVLKLLSSQWKQDNGVYSVEVMLLFGEAIKEIDNVID